MTIPRVVGWNSSTPEQNKVEAMRISPMETVKRRFLTLERHLTGRVDSHMVFVRSRVSRTRIDHQISTHFFRVTNH